jgi:NADPH:quinone reductase-like Zn-dependent oxidoreductase
MKAVRYDSYGPPDVLKLVEVEAPVPAADEILVRVRAAAVSRGDCGFRSGKPLFARIFTGLLGPKRHTVGQDFAGDVAAIGAEVTEFAVGDRVFGGLAFFGHGSGTQAEFVCVPESAPVAHIPDGLDYVEAAALGDGPFNSMNGLRPAQTMPGRRILVYGGSGSIGTAGIQLAKHYGLHITAVTDSRHVELVRSLGADVVIDYTQEDFRKRGERYDLIFDAVGKLTFGHCRGALVPGGMYIPTDGLVNFLWWLATKRFGSRKVFFMIPRYGKQLALDIKRLVENGEYRPIIDRTYPLDEVVEATRYVETGQKTGNVVLTI